MLRGGVGNRNLGHMDVGMRCSIGHDGRRELDAILSGILAPNSTVLKRIKKFIFGQNLIADRASWFSSGEDPERFRSFFIEIIRSIVLI